MVHDLSPFLFRISGDIGVRWYGLSYIAGFITAYFIISWMAKRQKMGMTSEMVSDFITYSAIGILVGGRLGYCIFYSPDLFLNFKSSFPFWGVLAVNEGGMASHGGIIGLVAACGYFSFKHNISRLYLFDLAAVTGPIGIFYGRIANYINGELLGRPVEGAFPFSVRFPIEILNWPTEQFGKLSELSVVAEKIPGMSKDMWIQWVDNYRLDAGARTSLNQGLSKIIEEIQNGNQAAKEAIAPFLIERYPSQLIASLGEGLFIFLVLFIFWYKPRRPGVIGALFVTLYAAIRIFTEQFRLPDAHIGYQLFGLTRGQWLSVAMLVIGLLLLFFWNRRSILATPGWGLGRNIKVHRRN
jgi:phosphatidylglycerol---prolipoprotein diacylglyceryl transferase